MYARLLGRYAPRPERLYAGGVRAALRFAFIDLGLQRVEAACLPNNMASIGLLEKAGFQREGYARRYLCIAGVWQDHLLFACLKDDLVL
uniref:GNAT family N-acetyltransferase n=1 Tax=Chelatococcus asaccharovorans TaxID=28210 RepID=UPI002B26DAB0|nr:GNAT family protein [Chelatococcus asaccharovorans]